MALKANDLLPAQSVFSNTGGAGMPGPSFQVTPVDIINAGNAGSLVTSGPTLNLTAGGFYPIALSPAGALTVNLPSNPTNGMTITVKDTLGNCATYNITLTAAGTPNIDGSATYVMNVNYTSITLAFNGTNWSII